MEGLISVTYLPTTSQLTDVFSKALPSAQFNHLLSKLGLACGGLLRILLIRHLHQLLLQSRSFFFCPAQHRFYYYVICLVTEWVTTVV